jgi:hypothetical protein
VCDNREYHANTQIPTAGGWERLSVICYFHDSNLRP